MCVTWAANRFGPNLPRTERDEGPRTVCPSLITAPTIMTAGTELVWKQQLAICQLQWLRCGYRYMINTFHHLSPLQRSARRPRKFGSDSSSKLVRILLGSRCALCFLLPFCLVFDHIFEMGPNDCRALKTRWKKRFRTLWEGVIPLIKRALMI